MLSIYIAPDQNETTYKDLVERLSVKSNFRFENENVLGHERRKMVLSPVWSETGMSSLCFTNSAQYIDTSVHQSERYVTQALTQENSDLFFVISTAAAYQNNLTGAIESFLMERNYSKALIETFVSVSQELVNNAVIHGNLGLDLHLAEILQPETYSEESLEQLQQTFAKIQSMLEDEAYGKKPITIRLNCFPGSIALDIQDQGAGFDIEAFKEKYKDTKFIKGMDMVFLMSKDIQYNANTKTMSIILEDPESHIPEGVDIQPENVRLGVYTQNPRDYMKMRNILRRANIKKIIAIQADQARWETLGNDIDVLLLLSDIRTQSMLEVIETVRRTASRVDLPILCQKREDMNEETISRLGQYVNDFISPNVHRYELISRIKAHCSMSAVRDNIVKFYTHYLSEISQSKRTIESLEAAAPLYLKSNNSTQFWMLANNSQTILESAAQITNLQQRADSAYGNSLSFKIASKRYVVYMSMRDGLSSILMMSYLKGYISRLQNEQDVLAPEELISKIENYIEKILPISLKLNVICTCWDEEEAAFSCATKGAFRLLSYSHTTEQFQTIQGYHLPRPQETLYALDPSETFNIEQLKAIAKNTLELSQDNITPDTIRALSLYNDSKLKVPYLMISPTKKACA